MKLRGEIGGVAELENLPKIEWLIPGWLPSKELSMLYGKEGAFKSFIALGWSLALAATGHPMFYIAAEGRSGLRARVQAWCAGNLGHPSPYDVRPHRDGHNPGQAIIDNWRFYDANLYIDTAGQRGRDEPEELSVDLETIQPELIIVDTLDRNFSGDENSTAEMGHFIDGVERWRRELDAAVLIIHHARKDTSSGIRERGTTALTAAMFGVLKVEQPRAMDSGASITLECDKMKDALKPDPVRVEFDKVAIDFDEGDVIEDSLSMKDPFLKRSRPAKRGGSGRIEEARDLLKSHGEMSRRELAELTGWDLKSCGRLLDRLLKQGWLIKDSSSGVYSWDS